MKIVINNPRSRSLEIISLGDLNNFYKTCRKFSSLKGALDVKIFTVNELINTHQLIKFKNNFDKINIHSLSIYSNNRETILAGKSLKIDSTFVKEHEIAYELHQLSAQKKEDILHEGTVRSGERIYSNGNLCIIGDVNPGAIISARKNIYVWGKLLGIAFAGKGGDKKASIASLYLNPLQLRIADVIAIGPKDKPKNHYPEIAVIDKLTINIKPYIIETKN